MKSALANALSSIAYGVILYGETIRTGGWLAAEIVAIPLAAAGCVELSRSIAKLHAAPAPLIRPSTTAGNRQRHRPTPIHEAAASGDGEAAPSENLELIEHGGGSR